MEIILYLRVQIGDEQRTLINKSIQEENGELVEKSSLSIDFDSESDEEVSQADPVHPKLNSSHL